MPILNLSAMLAHVTGGDAEPNGVGGHPHLQPIATVIRENNRPFQMGDQIQVIRGQAYVPAKVVLTGAGIKDRAKAD